MAVSAVRALLFVTFANIIMSSWERADYKNVTAANTEQQVDTAPAATTGVTPATTATMEPVRAARAIFTILTTASVRLLTTL